MHNNDPNGFNVTDTNKHKFKCINIWKLNRETDKFCYNNDRY